MLASAVLLLYLEAEIHEDEARSAQSVFYTFLFCWAKIGEFWAQHQGETALLPKYRFRRASLGKNRSFWAQHRVEIILLPKYRFRKASIG